MIYVGTCSWAEKTLIKSGEFYPKGVSTAEDRLRFYSGNFRTVEVDASYYAIPDRRTTALWAQRTPGGFLFHVKAYGALTGHGVDLRTLPKDLQGLFPADERHGRYVYIKNTEIKKTLFERFKDSLGPLVKAGKLGVVVFQYPPWFHYRPSNLDFILECKNHLEGVSLAVEFRHGSWLTPERAEYVFEFLGKNGITYITADEPQYGTLATVPFLPGVTTDTAYFRLHGRNKKNWLKTGIETSLRYDYLYSDDELKGFVSHVLEADRDAKKTFVMFNNCHGGFAIKNAIRIRTLIEESEKEMR
jgi:uncharacterized protein YecE (DUF72 family)